ncbi:hypothetical protein [Bacillus kexueae]|uniref:hypothetical protein n=1 Tax=Aeribacillus kexueae TaxID=2078952 RepID=UPI001FB02595|nr:hypothetical protein [Bacillus kexueae]
MKRLFIVIFSLLALYIVYYDLKVGTLPSFQEQNATFVTKEEQLEVFDVDQSISFQLITVNKGDTVLSIVERINEQSEDISIETIIADFEQLNPSTKAHNILIGEAYKFPLYK